jgi:hypothetical protein
MNRTRIGRRVGYLLSGMTLLILGGCPSASVTTTRTTLGPLPRPDMIVVYDFAVTSAEVKLDSGVMQKAMRGTSSREISEEENAVGHAVANRLSEDLVAELRKAGIAATRAGAQVMASNTTVHLTGEFVTIDEGSQTARVWVGFGLGGTQLRTRVQLVQGGQLIAAGETSTKSSLKPGILVSAGVAAGAESAVPLVVGGTAHTISETVRGTIEADAGRTAEEVAKRVIKAYQDRGWLP